MKKNNEEIELFREIWNERPHRCIVTGEYLGEFNVSFFSHVLSKGARPDLKLNKENIVLMSFDAHYKWDNWAKSRLTGKEWDLVREVYNKFKYPYQ